MDKKKKKINIHNIIQKLKGDTAKIPMVKTLNDKLVHPMFQERDMRQEAIDIGAHNAKEYFGKK